MKINKLWYNGKLIYDSTKRGIMKSNNNAPKTIKGDYDLSIRGNKIVLVDNADGTTVETKCHPDDYFDIGIGIKEAFNKLNAKREINNKELKVGDWIEVIDNNYMYTTYPEWFYNRVDFNFIKNYDYGNIVPTKTLGRVIALGNHLQYKYVELVGFQYNNKLYLIDKKGIKKVIKN